MHNLIIRAARVAALLSLAFAGIAAAQSQDPGEPKPPPPPNVEPKNVPTPIRSFADAAGAWTGQVDLTTRVVMYIDSDGMVKFYGPRDITKQATIEDQRLVIADDRIDLDCGIMNEKLVCHSRFGRMWADLNLTKVVWYPRRGW